MTVHLVLIGMSKVVVIEEGKTHDHPRSASNVLPYTRHPPRSDA
jgi:hypothetical protein